MKPKGLLIAVVLLAALGGATWWSNKKEASASKSTGDAANDPGFTGSGSSVRYVVSTGKATGPFKVEAELWFQPIGFRWAHNLAPYKAEEAQRLVRYYEEGSQRSAVVLAKAEATR